MASDSSPKNKFLEYVKLAVPITIVDWIVLALQDRFFSQPWHALFFVVPLTVAVIGWIFWKIKQGQPPLVGRSFLAIFSIYLLIFAVCAGTNILNYRRTLIGYEYKVPANFLSLSRLGDWRYWFARQTHPDADFAIVVMDSVRAPGDNPALSQAENAARKHLEGRFDIARLIKLAVAAEARGIAFDFYFNKNSTAEVDSLLCTEIKNAGDKKVPVLVGYGFSFVDGEPIRDLVASNLKPCLPDESQGSLGGYLESDDRVRMIPLHLKNNSALESLSLKISKLLHKNLKPPPDDLVQFIKPVKDFPQIRYQDLIYHPDEVTRNNERLKLRDKFLLVGEPSTKDTFETPYGPHPGVVIHSFAVHSLRHNHYLERAPWWSSLLVLLFSCYVITLLFDRKVRTFKTFGVALLATLIIWILALMAVRYWQVWIDIIYPLLAMWLLFLLLWIWQRASKRQPEETQADPDVPKLDTFASD